MALRAKPKSPIPAAELAALQEQLQGAYHSALWESETDTLLVAIVPGDEPDVINDLEQVVEHADPADVEVATGCLLVGNKAIHNVPVTPAKALMADRIAFDRRQEETLRAQLPASLAHTLYKAPADPRKRLRLAVRVPEEHVADLSDQDMDTLVDRLGPLLDKGRLDRLHCVHVIASKDAVRIEAAPFLEDLRKRWEEEGHARLEALRDPPALEQVTEKRPGTVQETEPGAPTADPARRIAEHVPTDQESTPVSTDPRFERTEQELDTMRSAIDALASDRSVEEVVDQVITATPSGSPYLDRLRSTLEAAGFAVRVRPDAGGYVVDLAAERPDEEIQRVIAVETDRFEEEDAEDLLETARALEVDLAIALCRDADRSAGRRVVATQVRIVTRDELPQLRL